MRSDEEVMLHTVANLVLSQPGIAITQLFRLNAGVQPDNPSKFAKKKKLTSYTLNSV